jgi:anti-sigma factor RsiW
MDCREWQEKLIDFILEELPPEEVREVELHVKGCAKCAAALGEFKGLGGMMKQHFTDREMPAHLVLVPERPASVLARFPGTSWGAAALGGALAALFVVGLFLGGFFGPARGLFVHEPAEKGAPTRADIEAIVAREVSDKLSQQKMDFQMQNEKLATSLRQEQVRNLSELSKHLEYVHSAQSLIWKEAQQQNALVELIARNSLGGAKPSVVKSRE